MRSSGHPARVLRDAPNAPLQSAADVVPARVLIAAGDEKTRADIRSALCGAPDFEVCAQAGDAAAAVDAALQERPDLCLLESGLPGFCLAAAWEISARLPSVKFVVLGEAGDEAGLFRALRAGASGYIDHPLTPAGLRRALRGVIAGEAAISRRLVACMAERFRDTSPSRRRPLPSISGARLTAREWEVLELLRRSLTTAELAERLGVSPGTVRSHVASIVHKLGAADRDAAVGVLDGAETVGGPARQPRAR
jgi:DNA-binding NarL/FixJ family response regulator